MSNKHKYDYECSFCKTKFEASITDLLSDRPKHSENVEIHEQKECPNIYFISKNYDFRNEITIEYIKQNWTPIRAFGIEDAIDEFGTEINYESHEDCPIFYVYKNRATISDIKEITLEPEYGFIGWNIESIESI